MTTFVLLRVRAHRLLLAAALLAVLLTTTVLTTLTAFSGAVGEAALRHTLNGRSAAPAALVVRGEVAEKDRAAADRAVAAGASRTFDGLPVTVRSLPRSGPYTLPGATSEDDAELTHLAAVDRSRIELVAGEWPADGARDGAGTGTERSASGSAKDPVPVALPETAATLLKLKPGGEPITLADRLGEGKLTVRVTGLYRAADPADPYWQLDELGGRGVRKLVFTTYGPMLASPAALTGGRVSTGTAAWLATADYRTLDSGRVDALRDAAVRGPAKLAKNAVLGTPDIATGLPKVLDQAERALLVSRSTLLIVALQLVLLAGYALLLVARLLSSERSGETEILLARGGSRGRVASLAAIEAALLALPAVVLAPLLAGPLTRLLAGQGALSRIGLRIDTSLTPAVWLVAGVTALGCALAVIAPALASTGIRSRVRASALPAPLRAGADVALLVIAAVAYWQLDRQTSGGGAVGGDGGSSVGGLGIDPLLVAAPALALLAGTVLTLRLLPPTARLAERRAARGRGLPGALAGWQLSRRPLRGAGPVLLLVLAMAMGMLAIGQGASWDRSQEDQADFAAGSQIRVEGGRIPELERGWVYGSLPGVESASAAARSTVPLSGGRTATVLALDARYAADGLLLRDDLGDRTALADDLTRATAPKGSGTSDERRNSRTSARAGLLLPQDTTRLELDVTLGADSESGAGSGADSGADSGAGDESAPGAGSGTGPAPQDPVPGSLTVVVEDRFGSPHFVRLGELPADGDRHTFDVDLAGATGKSLGAVSAAAPYAVTEFRMSVQPPERYGRQQRLSVRALRTAAGEDGEERPVGLPDGFAWDGYRALAGTTADGGEQPRHRLEPDTSAAEPLTVPFSTGVAAPVVDDFWGFQEGGRLTVRVMAHRQKPAPLTGVATTRFLDSAGAKVGSTLDVPFAGDTLKVRITRSVTALPTTAPADTATGRAEDGGALLVDLNSVNSRLHQLDAPPVTPAEWWLTTRAGQTEQAAAALRARPDTDPEQVLVRDRMADGLRDDPLGAGPQAALLAMAVVAAALAAVGFAVSAAGSLRERGAELSVLRALGAPRRQLARLVAAEQGVLIGLALIVGPLLGVLLTRAVVPLIVLTGQATQPLPAVLVELPLGRVAALLAGIVAVPLLIVGALALRRGDPKVTLRHEGGN